MSAVFRSELFARLQPTVLRGIVEHYEKVLNDSPLKEIGATEDDRELAADVTDAVIAALPSVDQWMGDEVLRLRNAHGLFLDGPLRYPGGKDGMYQVVCTCGMWRSSPGSTPRYAPMWDAGRAHSEAKRNHPPQMHDAPQEPV